VAASMGMYSLAQYPPDSFLWEFMAYAPAPAAQS